MTRLLYSSLLYIIAPLQFINLWWRGKTLPAYRLRWGERLGKIPKLEVKPRIWLHAVSVGEVNAAVPLIEQLLQDYSDHALLVTSTTPTGSEQLKRRFGARIEHFYFPYDLPHVIRRFLKRSRPRILVVMETELWPNCFYLCQRKGIPVVIVNARISDKSYQGYKKIRKFIQPAIQNISHICAQGDSDRDRFICLGVEPKKVDVVGNIKFDLPAPDIGEPDTALQAIQKSQRPVWIAASTHDDEEQKMLTVHRTLLHTLPNALLILVPRHPERFESIAGLCNSRSFNIARRSKQEVPDENSEIYLGDTMGELMKLYAEAQVAFVGGSLVPTGGHNPIEPASLGVPVLAGPNTQNFRDIYASLIHAEGGRIVADEQELHGQLLALLTNQSEREQLSQQASLLLQQSQGATQRITKLLMTQLPG